MTLLESLRRRLRWDGIQNLPLIIVATQGVVYIWIMMQPSQLQMLVLDPFRVQVHGEYWRLITFLFVIGVHNPLFAFFHMFLQYWFGTQLENEWGSFQFTVFYLVGVLGTMIAGFFFGSVAGAMFLHESIFLAFATLNPNYRLMAFPLPIPIQIKWFALLVWLRFLYYFFTGPLALKLAIVVSIANYILFFCPMLINNVRALVRQETFKRKLKDYENDEDR